LYGTGIRFRSSLANVTAAILEFSVEYAGPQGVFPGLDQVNMRIPTSFFRRRPGWACLVLAVDGRFLFPGCIAFK